MNFFPFGGVFFNTANENKTLLLQTADTPSSIREEEKEQSYISSTKYKVMLFFNTARGVHNNEGFKEMKKRFMNMSLENCDQLHKYFTPSRKDC